MQIIENYALKKFNTFGIEARTRWFTEVFHPAEISETMEYLSESGAPCLILGGGSNILFTRDYPGLVMKIGLKGISQEPSGDTHLVHAAAGETWNDLVSYCVDQGLHGIENMILIPGSCGAAPIQNIGAYGMELKDTLHSVEALETATGITRTFTAEECRFGYRDSIFKRELKDKFVITRITLALQKHAPLKTGYGAIQEELARSGKSAFTLRDVADAVASIRRSKLPDPSVTGNAGSFFKNPEIDGQQFQFLLQTWPDLPSYPASALKVKVPAAWLIEKAGWKGKRFGNYGVHDKQALVLVNYGGAKGEDIWRLSEDIRRSVLDMFGIALEREVNVI